MKSSLEMKVIRGANWFFWVAGLSVINSILSATHATIVFVIGLGVAQFGGLIAASAIAVFALFGYFARKGMRWAFAIGMLLYALDGSLFVIARDWFAVAFHVLALYFMYQGLAAASMGKQNEQLMRDMAIRAALQKDAALRAAAAAQESAPAPAPVGDTPQPWRPPAPPEPL